MSGENSAAKRKRRPFTIKNGEQVTHIYCILHPEEVATFYCSICGKPHDEACVGSEKGGKTTCISCSAEDARTKSTGTPKWVPMALAAIAIIISVSNAIYYYVNRPQPGSHTSQPQLSKQIQDIVLCRQRLERIAREASYYYQTAGTWPSSLDELSSLFDDNSLLVDPLTGQPFETSVENNQFTVYAPVPEAYGLKEIYAVPGKPARIKYIGSEGTSNGM